MTEQNAAPDVKALVERLEDQAAAYRYADRPLFASWLTEAATALEAQAARAEAAESRAEAMERALCDADARLGNLLARVHRDGGHYQDQHGTEKACADADLIVSDLLAAQDRAEAMERALRKIADHPTGGVGCNPVLLVEEARAALATPEAP